MYRWAEKNQRKKITNFLFLFMPVCNFSLTDFRSDPPCSDMFCLRLNRLFLPHMARQFKRIQINFFGNPDSSGYYFFVQRKKAACLVKPSFNLAYFLLTPRGVKYIPVFIISQIMFYLYWLTIFVCFGEVFTRNRREFFNVSGRALCFLDHEQDPEISMLENFLERKVGKLAKIIIDHQ